MRSVTGWRNGACYGSTGASSPSATARPQPGAAALAAVLAYDPSSLLFGPSAAAWWNLARPPESVHVAVCGRNVRSQSGIVVHRVAALADDERATRHGVPVTSVARTLVDLAATARPRELERVVSEAVVQRLIDEPDLRAACERYAGRAGVARLRDCVGDGPTATRSQAEELYLSLVRRAELPAPRVNVRLGRWQVDFFWPAYSLVVEIDGVRFHSTRRAVERDHRKDAELDAARLRLRRFTWNRMRSGSSGSRGPDGAGDRAGRALACGCPAGVTNDAFGVATVAWAGPRPHPVTFAPRPPTRVTNAGLSPAAAPSGTPPEPCPGASA